MFGYLVLRGRCRHCRAPISPRYPIAEAATAVLFVLAVVHFGVTLQAAVYAGFFWVLVVLTVIDLEHHVLPDAITYPALVAAVLLLPLIAALNNEIGTLSLATAYATLYAGGLAIIMSPLIGERSREEDVDELSKGFSLGTLAVVLVPWLILILLLVVNPWSAGLSGAALGAALLAGLLFALAAAHPWGMGMGDVKLALLLGLFLGYAGGVGVTLVGMFLSFAFGAFVSTGLMIAGKAGRKSAVPFGPFLAAGTVSAILWGRSILDVYLGRF